MRGSRGPRQPGGGKQIAGPRHPKHGKPQGRFPSPSSRVRGEGEGGLRPPSFKQERDAKHRYGEGAYPQAQTRGKAPSPDRLRSAHAVDLSPQAGRGEGGVQNVAVTADEGGMRVDRFLEARFPGLSFSHIQRVIRKGEVRVNGKRTQPKNRLEAGQTLRIPPLRLEQPKTARGGERSRRKNPRLPRIDHAFRRRRRARAQQADGARGAGRFRHHASPRRHARGVARRARPAPAAGAPARQGHRRLSPRRQDALCRGGAGENLPLALGAQDLLGAGRRRAEAAAGPHLDLSRQGGARGGIASCASRATARRAPATR